MASLSARAWATRRSWSATRVVKMAETSRWSSPRKVARSPAGTPSVSHRLSSLDAVVAASCRRSTGSDADIARTAGAGDTGKVPGRRGRRQRSARFTSADNPRDRRRSMASRSRRRTREEAGLEAPGADAGSAEVGFRGTSSSLSSSSSAAVASSAPTDPVPPLEPTTGSAAEDVESDGDENATAAGGAEGRTTVACATEGCRQRTSQNCPFTRCTRCCVSHCLLKNVVCPSHLRARQGS